ncbi:MAG: histidine kinase [Proteobacteria bacterium]|nr:histidine kinase [Desulfobacula sp.]MBU4130292.1 histidine kinase [Pseudomonadota bacterium]
MTIVRKYSKSGLLEIINALPLAICVIDKNRSVVLANKVVHGFTNKNSEPLIDQIAGKALGCVNHDRVPDGCGFGPECLKCKLKEALTHTLEKREPTHMVETTMAFKGKGVRVLRISTQPLNLGGKEVTLLSIEDLTDLRSHEKTRLEKEKLSAVLETAGAVCHELSQPLQVINGFCDILIGHKGLDSEITQALDAILKEVRRMGRLNHDLMHITRYETKPYLKSKIIDIEKSSTDS